MKLPAPRPPGFSVALRQILSLFAAATFVLGNLPCTGQETNATAPNARPEDTNSLEVWTSYLQLQEQLHATQLAIERNRKDADAAASESTKALMNRMAAVEQALSAQRTRELDVIQSSNKMMLLLAGGFVAMGFLAMLMMIYFQWKAVNRLADISAALPGRTLAPAVPLALGPGETHVLPAHPAENANQRLLGALEKLEQRIYDLEHTARAPLPQGQAVSAPFDPSNGGGSGFLISEEVSPVARIEQFLRKAQDLLNAEKPEEALAALDEALALDSAHAEALVKKGAALEKLQKLDQAIECYDRAIASNNSMTIAYLHKGGLFNRMERFSEALECYEQALRTQEKRVA